MLIKVDVPDAARAVYSDAAIRQALASVTFRPAPIQEQLGLLPFKLGEMAGFRVVKVTSRRRRDPHRGAGRRSEQAALHGRIDRRAARRNNPTTAQSVCPRHADLRRR